MKKLAGVLALAGGMGFATAPEAGIVWYEFSFTGADMMSYEFVDGADGSTAADNGLFDGARLQERDSGTTYVASQHDIFTDWRNTTTDRYLSFNLWGFDGNGAHWGEDFKPYEWGTTSEPADWSSWTVQWPWGSPPAGYHTDLILGWDAASFADGMHFDDPDLADLIFSFQVAFDTTDMFWGQDTQGAPNSLPEMTFWFGGWFNDDEVRGEENVDYYSYEGNLVLTGTKLPEPATVGLLGLGLAGLGWRRYRRR